MVPVIVGRVTLRADAMAETARKHKPRVRLCGLHWLKARTEITIPARYTVPM